MVVLKQALIWFLARPAAKALVLDALEAIAKRTDNTVDDKVMRVLRYALEGQPQPVEAVAGAASSVTGAVTGVAGAFEAVAGAVKAVKEAGK